MAKVIEILDSDDDLALQNDEQGSDVQPSSSEQNHINSQVEISTGLVGGSSEKETALQFEGESVITTDPKLSTFSTNASDSPRKSRSRHRRKSLHQPMRASPEMQFETISLDDEDDDSHTDVGSLHAEQSNIAGKAKSFKTIPKILTVKPATTEELIQASCDEFLDSEEVDSAMRQIAEERIRINFLLASYGMPDISFSLYTQYERLKFQFEDRLKQRKMRSWIAGQENKIKKPRSMPKENHSTIN